MVPWLPERSWVETPATASRARSPHPARRRLLSRGSGGDWRYGEIAPAAAEQPGAPRGVDRAHWADRADRSDRLDRPPRPGRAQPGRHRRPVPPGPRFLTVPASLRGARLSGPRAAAAGLLLVVLVAAVAFGVRVAWAKAASTPQVVAPSLSGSALGDQHATGSVFASSSTASGGGGPPAGGWGTVTVHVVGQVKRPGVFRMPAGSRVGDAVAEAGGGKGADLAAINLARPLVDGEQIHVPRPGEVLAGGVGGGTGGGAGAGSGSAGSGSGSAGAGGSGGGGPGAAGSTSGAAGQVNLNAASAAELEELPGVGPVLAQRIIDWRTEHGRFASVDELGEVSGIGEKIFAALQPKVTV